MSVPFDLKRFVLAQESVYSQVCDELRRGHKRSHWIWFIFPQMKGLGHSSMADKYGIVSEYEAEAYLAHPVLGPRLIECTELVNAVQGRSISQIFGYPDDMKFRSSMTLFAHIADGNDVFVKALEKYFAGQPDQMTLDLL